MPDFDHSNRSETLFMALKPFLRDGDSVLDVGCGYADHPKMQGTILPRLIGQAFKAIRWHGVDHRADIIEACRKEYPGYEWTVGDASTLPVRRYDVVLHLGFDRKDLSNAWKVHSWLLDTESDPRVVLLEAGNPVGKSSGHVASFLEVKAIYEAAGYAVRVSGAYRWSYKVTQPERRYVVLEKR